MSVKVKILIALFGVAMNYTTILSAQSLEEIVVTAQKRAETLSEVPISISAVTGETLENRSIDSLATLSQSMPNVNIFEGVGGSQDEVCAS